MYLKKLRQRVHDRSRPPLAIVPITLPSPEIVEIVGFAGGEAVMLDAEHGTIDPETMRSMLVHAQSAGTAAVYRPRSFNAAECRQALDAGAAGIHVSHVDTADEARAVVSACRYAPLGDREMSLGRAVDYHLPNYPAYLEQANDSELLVVMIESRRALENIDSIAAVPGIDVLHIGTADLTHSLGYTFGQSGSEAEIQEARLRVLKAAATHDKTAGLPLDEPDKVHIFTEMGFRYFELDPPDYLLQETYSQKLKAIDLLLENTG